MEKTLDPRSGGVWAQPEPTTADGRPLHRLALAVAATTALFDFLFYDAPIGATAGAFTLAALALLGWAHPLALATRLGGALAAGVLAVAASQAIEPTRLAAALAVSGLAAFGWVAREPRRPAGIEWLQSFASLAWRGWLDWHRDLRAARARLSERQGWRGRLGQWLGDWLLPAALSLPFVWLFTLANPVIELGLDDLFDWLANFLEALTVTRILLWAVVGSGLWALLRTRARVDAPTLATVEAGRRALVGSMLVRCLLVFNALFAIQTAFDLGYFWSGFSLPEGMSYAEYAHRGAYPLVGTTLLAILFVLVAFHDAARDDVTPERLRARRLVYLWLAQNAFLLVSAAARLDLYIEVYQLTYFRIASVIWMGLVGAGLLWTVAKIALGRSNAWLVDANLATAGLVLVLCCFPNWGRLVAEHNVERALATGSGLDVYYLARNVGPEALPALRHYWSASPVTGPDEFAVCNDRRLRRELGHDLDDWRGTTLRRRALAGRLRTIPPLGGECSHSC
jgi:hypothetical protein